RGGARGNLLERARGPTAMTRPDRQGESKRVQEYGTDRQRSKVPPGLACRMLGACRTARNQVTSRAEAPTTWRSPPTEIACGYALHGHRSTARRSGSAR